jgi:hypothetical protein
MNALLSFRVDVQSIQKLTALRDQLAGSLEEDEDVQLIAKNQAQDDAPPEPEPAPEPTPDVEPE